jgi:hypothetical protein
MSTVFITPAKHILKETEIGRLFRRLLKFQDIFTYWNAETGQWILAYWVNRLGNIADEVEDLGMAMELVTPPFVKQIVDCWKPVDWRLKKKMILRRAKNFKTKKDEQIIQSQDTWDWAKKRLGDRAPIPFGFMPSLKGGQ